MRYEALTGLCCEQLHDLSIRVLERAGDVVRPGGRPAGIGLFRSVAMVVTLLVDGTVCPVWDWAAIPGLFSGKARYAGMNVQIAATLGGGLAAVGPVPVPGARHDAYAFAASGLKDLIAGMDAAADLGYTGVDGIAIVPFRTPPGGQLHESQAEFNVGLSKIRAAAERAVAHLKTWRMLSEEGGRFRPPLAKFESTLKAITGLLFFSNYHKVLEEGSSAWLTTRPISATRTSQRFGSTQPWHRQES